MPHSATRKPVVHVTKPEVVHIKENYYLIGGKEEVYLLNTDRSLEMFSQKLTKQEIEELEAVIGMNLNRYQ